MFSPKTYFVGQSADKANKNFASVAPLFGDGAQQRFALSEYGQAITTYLTLPAAFPRGRAFQELEATRALCVTNAAILEGVTLSEPIRQAATSLSYYHVNKARQHIHNEREADTVNTSDALKAIGMQDDYAMMHMLVGQSLGREKASTDIVLFYNEQQQDIFDRVIPEEFEEDHGLARFACKIGILNEFTLQMARESNFNHMCKKDCPKNTVKSYESKAYDTLLKTVVSYT